MPSVGVFMETRRECEKIESWGEGLSVERCAITRIHEGLSMSGI
jgi:hypothetical protein